MPRCFQLDASDYVQGRNLCLPGIGVTRRRRCKRAVQKSGWCCVLGAIRILAKTGTVALGHSLSRLVEGWRSTSLFVFVQICRCRCRQGGSSES